MTRTSRLIACCVTISLATGANVVVANEKLVSSGVDADTMIALDTNSTALPPPVGSNSSGAFGTGLEQANPLNGQPLTMRGGNPFDTGSIAAKPLIRFNLGSTTNLQ